MTAPVAALKPCRLSNFPSSPWSPDATRSRQTCLSIPLTELNQYPPGKRGQEDKMYGAMECDVWWKTSYRRCKKVPQRQVLSATGYKPLAQLRMVSPRSLKSIVKYNTVFCTHSLSSYVYRIAYQPAISQQNGEVPHFIPSQNSCHVYYIVSFFFFYTSLLTFPVRGLVIW